MSALIAIAIALGARRNTVVVEHLAQFRALGKEQS